MAISPTESLTFPQPYSHLHRSVVDSCDGLLFLVQGLDFILWNPCTRYSKVLPRIQFPFANKRQPFCGFGYDSTTDDYKFSPYGLPSLHPICILESGEVLFDAEFLLVVKLYDPKEKNISECFQDS